MVGLLNRRDKEAVVKAIAIVSGGDWVKADLMVRVFRAKPESFRGKGLERNRQTFSKLISIAEEINLIKLRTDITEVK